jgi:hypothetical protein
MESRDFLSTKGKTETILNQSFFQEKLGIATEKNIGREDSSI